MKIPNQSSPIMRKRKFEEITLGNISARPILKGLQMQDFAECLVDCRTAYENSLGLYSNLWPDPTATYYGCIAHCAAVYRQDFTAGGRDRFEL